MQKISKVAIYADYRANDVDFNDIVDYVKGMVSGVDVELQPPLLETALALEQDEDAAKGEILLGETAEKFARAKIHDPLRDLDEGKPVLAGEIDYERRRLGDHSKGVFGLLYDAPMLSSLYADHIGYAASRLDRVNVVFTNQLIATWDEMDARYHARVVYCGSPAIISLGGMVVAPARTREYYLARQGAVTMGYSEVEASRVAGSFADDYLEHGDRRLGEVARGYILQVVAYRMTGEPFCGNPQCRLFNAHRQSEMLAAQLGGSDLCRQHSELFEA